MKVLRPLGTALAALCLLACNPTFASSGEEATPELYTEAETPAPMTAETRPAGTTFADVLTEYQALNSRLESVTAPLRLENAALCSVTERDPGFITHRLADYPEALQPIAQAYLGLKEDGIYIRSVRRESPAEQADILPGDRLVKLNGFPVPVSGVAQDRFYDAIARQAFGEVKTRLTLSSPDGTIYETSLRSDTACAVPVSVYYSDEVNGHTDGYEVMITSGLMNSVKDDVNLALIVAHEMAHVIAGHKDQTPTKDLELEADRIALVLMENAGYNIDAAIAYWQEAAHPHRDMQDSSRTHPTIQARYENFDQERSRIRRLQESGKTLTLR